MGVAEDLLGEGHNLITRLEDTEHELAAAFRAWFGRLTGRLPALETEAATDAEHVVRDAETAAAPPVAEAVHDSEHVAEQAVGAQSAAPDAAPATDAVPGL